MQTTTKQTVTPVELQGRFQTVVKSKIPHLRGDPSGLEVVNATPLVDITDQLVECAKSEFGLELAANNARVYGKFDSEIYGGSVKVRPAAQIIDEAIASGRLRAGMKVFEATSGNFGIALGMLKSLGFEVYALVSRKLQSGVVDQLEKDGVKLLNLDVDICPAPGQQTDTNLILAKAVAGNVREQLSNHGLNTAVFDTSRSEIEQLLARQDVINLAKLLARIYEGFCPEQYDNELNVGVHETITGPEIDQQLGRQGSSLQDFKVICTFGTGGTSTGIAGYIAKKHDKRGVHVIFPLSNQEVSGIRTRDKAAGLKFYQPDLYAGQHETDFEPAKRVLRFFTAKGYNIGESSALAIYACIQMLNFNAGDKFVVMIADGFQKYRQQLETMPKGTKRYEVTLQEARSSLGDYAEVLWTHTMLVPKEEGIKAIAASLGCKEDIVKVARVGDVAQVILSQELPETMRELLPNGGGRVLLVCMVGGTSLRLAKQLSGMGFDAESLTGGVMGVPENIGRHLSELVQPATE